MRLKQNFILVILIVFLLSIIAGIDTLNIISITSNQVNKDYHHPSGGEIKVNTYQTPQNTDKTYIEIIFDLSQSMWGKIEEEDKIITAKKVLKKIINDLPDKVYLGLRIFGNHNNSLLAIKFATNNRQELLQFIDQIRPKGKSPIGLSLMKAAEDLKDVNGKKHILLITDGKDNGEIMPAKIVQKITKQGIKTHIIQVGQLNKVTQLQLKDLAALGNGKYFTYFEEKEVIPTINLN